MTHDASARINVAAVKRPIHYLLGVHGACTLAQGQSNDIYLAWL